MSYLNALASDGLSVGLRFYTSKLNERKTEPPALPADEPQASACPAEAGEKAVPRAKTPAPSPQSPEEMAAGRTDAQARLAADGSLGQLQAKSRDEAGDPDQAAGGADSAGDGEAPPVAAPAPGGSKGLTPEEEREVARLKAQETQIKADVQASARSGDSGAASVQYTYTTGPDDNRYISGIQGQGQGQGGGSNQAAAPAAPADPRQMSEEERKQVDEMEQRDREVRTHEQAHVAAAAGLAGAPVYEYQSGPDGRRYAVGGHVDVKTSGSSNPDQALREAEAVKRAATAPADPSGADQAAASRASAEITRLKAEKSSDSGEDEYGALKNGDERAGGLKAQEELSDADKLGAATVYNGSSFGQQVLGAYAAAKFGPATAMVRPVLAQI